MTHYEVLGVAPSDEPAVLRRAYLDLARRYHPDQAGTTGADADRMREINAAWAVLGDPDRRVAYDRELADRRGRTSGADARAANRDRPGASFRRSHISHPPRDNRPSPGWVPIDDHSDDDLPDLNELIDDTPVPGTEVPRWMQVVPAYLLALAVLALVIGLIASLPEVVSLGVVAFVLSLVSFVAVPVFAIFASRSHDLDP